jgi:hypothetical protein
MVQQQNKEASLVKHEIAERVAIAPPNYCINRSAASEFRMVTFSALRRARLYKALGSNSFILMDAIELRRRGVELLSPVLVPYGSVYQAGEVDRGSGGLYAHGGSHERTVRWNSACAMRSVRSAIASMLPRYCTKTSPAPPLGADKRDTRVL